MSSTRSYDFVCASLAFPTQGVFLTMRSFISAVVGFRFLRTSSTHLFVSQCSLFFAPMPEIVDSCAPFPRLAF